LSLCFLLHSSQLRDKQKNLLGSNNLTEQPYPKFLIFSKGKFSEKPNRLLELKTEIQELGVGLQEIYIQTKQQLETLPGYGLAIASCILAKIKTLTCSLVQLN